MLNGLLHGIQSMNINIKPPRFGNDLMANPSEFVRQVKKYFVVKKVSDETKLLLLETLLDGRAVDWYRAQSNAYPDFNSFKAAFSKNFVPLQLRFVSKLNGRRVVMLPRIRRCKDIF